MTHIASLAIHGLRGFGKLQKLSLARPDGRTPGSGLTMLVGPNNGGKSTVVEAFRAVTTTSAPSFTEGKRNKTAEGKIQIRLHLDDGSENLLETVPSGGSETAWTSQSPTRPEILVLPSRRFFSPYFSNGEFERSQYVRSVGFPAVRGQMLDQFAYRLFHILKHREEFNEVLVRVLSPAPDWTIDLTDNGQYYIKFSNGGLYHNSDGLGEGIISLFFVVDALYDSQPGAVIVIDEPELSLHPVFQRRLANLLTDYAKDRQILYATHSPYFLNVEALLSGARVSRVAKLDSGSRIFDLSKDTIPRLAGLLCDQNNPHVLGLDAREAFFLEDKVVLVEGQEDVVFYPSVCEQIGLGLKGQFFGWGVGGADKMSVIAAVLRDLGFEKVVGILDRNRVALADPLRAEFPGFQFFVIPADDVRTKPATTEKPEIKGLLDENGNLREEYQHEMRKIFNDINAYLEPEPVGNEQE